MRTETFRLPDVGEGLTEAEIVRWRVAVGDTVAVDDVLVEIETAKSLVELPSPYAGTVTALLAAEGETVAVGAGIVTIGDAVAAARSAPGEAIEPAPSVLVGYGPAHGRTNRRRRRSTAAPRTPPTAAVPQPGPQPGPRSGTRPPAVPRLAKPPVRKLARDLGVELAAVAPGGADGLVTREDVLQHARTGAGTDPTLPAPSTRGAETRTPVAGVRRAIAAAMSTSAFTAPHVTEFLTVDVTRSVRLVERLRDLPAFEGSRVTLLLLVARALVAAARTHPDINASWDEAAGEIVRFERINLGIAAATPRGLLVPNTKDAGAQNLPELARSLTELVDAARDGRTTPHDMTGGTLTISNIGVFGVDAGTPILNPGEAAILCVGAVRRRPWEHKGGIALRSVLQLALSFDHRLVDGELGSRALAHVGRVLESPRTELLLA